MFSRIAAIVSGRATARRARRFFDPRSPSTILPHRGRWWQLGAPGRDRITDRGHHFLEAVDHRGAGDADHQQACAVENRIASSFTRRLRDMRRAVSFDGQANARRKEIYDEARSLRLPPERLAHPAHPQFPPKHVLGEGHPLTKNTSKTEG